MALSQRARIGALREAGGQVWQKGDVVIFACHDDGGGAHIISASRTVLLLAYSLTRTGDGFDGDRDGGCSGVPREG